MYSHTIPANVHIGEAEDGRISVFASDIGLKAGEWPEVLQTHQATGSVRIFHRGTPVMNDDELMYVNYATSGWPNATILVVFND